MNFTPIRFEVSWETNRFAWSSEMNFGKYIINIAYDECAILFGTLPLKESPNLIRQMVQHGKRHHFVVDSKNGHKSTDFVSTFDTTAFHPVSLLSFDSGPKNETNRKCQAENFHFILTK